MSDQNIDCLVRGRGRERRNRPLGYIPRTHEGLRRRIEAVLVELVCEAPVPERRRVRRGVDLFFSISLSAVRDTAVISASWVVTVPLTKLHSRV